MSPCQRVELPSHEVLSRLAREDPQAYEAWRRKAIESFIDSAPARIKPRLMGIQFRVDHVRRLHRSAMGTTVRIYEMMWQSFLRLNQDWQDLVRMNDECAGLNGSTMSTQGQLSGSARILEFRPRSPLDHDCEP